MLIVSKFHDYYDSALGIGGVDKTVVYNRQEVDHRKRKKPFNSNSFYQAYRNRRPVRLYENRIVIGFCGEVYKAVGFEVDYSSDLYYKYTYEDTIKEVEALGIKTNPKKHWYGRIDSFDLKDSASVKRFFDDPLPDQPDLMALMRTYKAPIVVYRHGDDGVIVNPCLKTYGFQQVKDPFTAFQEIQGYISGVLGVDARPMVEISDKSKIEKHGFFKWSFRREPWKHKK